MDPRDGEDGEPGSTRPEVEDGPTRPWSPVTPRPEPDDAEMIAFPLRRARPRRGEDAAFPPGTLLERKYRVVRTLGRGGMGVVLEAWRCDLDVRMAIKLLLPELASSRDSIRRFLREARAVARLRSDHVARVIDVGTLEGGEPFIVMEYLEGEDLARRARAAGPIAAGDAIEYTVQACDALAEAHALGIVHRDLKLANLFLTSRPDGAPLVKVLDFGVSKVAGEPPGDAALTRTAMVVGSILTMSPEQMRSSRDVDHRTDIYALGVCLFQLLAGRPPHSAESLPELYARICGSPPAPLRDIRPDVPEGLVGVIERCIAPRPDDRYESVAELLRALSPFGRESTRAAALSTLRRWAPDTTLPPSARGGVNGARGRGASPGRRWAVLGAVAAGAVSAWIAARAPRAGDPPIDPAPAEVAAPAAALGSGPGVGPRAAGEAGGAVAANASAPEAGAPGGAGSGGPIQGRALTSASASQRPVGRRPAPPVQPSLPDAAALPEPKVSRELVQEVCTAILPDGARRAVPCE
ncbi:MAG: serine/threonine protein kinase [Polyangiaceae bacterium]|nr:serine/threonine protein kinase [Polyangiaceae bacterium]